MCNTLSLDTSAYPLKSNLAHALCLNWHHFWQPASALSRPVSGKAAATRRHEKPGSRVRNDWATNTHTHTHTHTALSLLYQAKLLLYEVLKRTNEVTLLSRVRLFVTPWTVAHQDSLSMGFSRQEYWSGLPFPYPGGLPDPGIEPGSPALQADALPEKLGSKVRNDRTHTHTHTHTHTQHWSFLCQEKLLAQGGMENEGAELFYDFDSMSPVLLFTYGTKKHAPLPEIHLYDLEVLQNLAFQYLSDSISPISPHWLPSSFTQTSWLFFYRRRETPTSKLCVFFSSCTWNIPLSHSWLVCSLTFIRKKLTFLIRPALSLSPSTQCFISSIPTVLSLLSIDHYLIDYFADCLSSPVGFKSSKGRGFGACLAPSVSPVHSSVQERTAPSKHLLNGWIKSLSPSLTLIQTHWSSPSLSWNPRILLFSTFLRALPSAWKHLKNIYTWFFLIFLPRFIFMCYLVLKAFSVQTI